MRLLSSTIQDATSSDVPLAAIEDLRALVNFSSSGCELMLSPGDGSAPWVLACTTRAETIGPLTDTCNGQTDSSSVVAEWMISLDTAIKSADTGSSLAERAASARQDKHAEAARRGVEHHIGRCNATASFAAAPLLPCGVPLQLPTCIVAVICHLWLTEPSCFVSCWQTA